MIDNNYLEQGLIPPITLYKSQIAQLYNNEGGVKLDVKGFMEMVKSAKIHHPNGSVTNCLTELEKVGYKTHQKTLTKKMVQIIFNYLAPPSLNLLNRKFLIQNEIFLPEELPDILLVNCNKQL